MRPLVIGETTMLPLPAMGHAAVRLYALTARKARTAVIFRRGPSKRVALVKWDMARDQFTVGQWLHGRIYERRCDLSPSGELLVYFAANWKSGRGSWTAISRPPNLTALAMWPKGDAWGGGGLFESERRLALNHPEGQTELAEGFQLPKSFGVVPFGERPGRGEDDPIAVVRDRRDGWRRIRTATWKKNRRGSPIWYSAEGGEVHAQSAPGTKVGKGHALYRTLDGIHEQDGPWYVLRHSLVDEATGMTAGLGRSDWAAWDRDDVVFARSGRMYRLGAGSVSRLATEEAIELFDFRSLVFEERAPEAEAKRW